MNFEKDIKDFFCNSAETYGKVIGKEKKLVLIGSTMIFFLPIECKKQLFSFFEKENVNTDTFVIIRGGFDDLFFVEAKDQQAKDEIGKKTTYILKKLLTEQNIITNFIPAKSVIATIAMPELASVFETKHGLLQVNSDYIELAFNILQEFSKKKVRYFVDTKNNMFYIKNDVAEAAICPIKTTEKQKELFAKKFLI